MQIALLFLALLATGCSGHSYSQEHYGGVSRQVISTKYDRFGIWDRPDTGRMFVMVQVGADTGLIANLHFSEHPRPMFQEAAEQYLAQTARECVVYEGAEILTQRWEFKYRCA